MLVLDGELPAGVAANTAAILGATLGRSRPELVGADLADGAGETHRGIVQVPIPILRGDREELARLWAAAHDPAYGELEVLDFSDLAQGCRTYGEYAEKLSGRGPEELRWLGIGLCGPRKLVSRLTGSLPLLR